jgi:FlaA1/EpsC-like NDP-sugar epimerase
MGMAVVGGGGRAMAGIANSRRVRWVAFVYDVAIASFAMLAGIVLRLGTLDEIDNQHLFFGALLPFTTAAIVSFLVMRTYRTSWRHASTADLMNIFYAVGLTVLVYLPLSFVTTRLFLIPRSSVVIACIVLFLLMAGSRVAYRLFREGRLFFTRTSMRAGQVPILIVGGGLDAEIFLRSLDSASHYYPVGVLDNDGRTAQLRGVPVLGTIADAEAVIEDFTDAGDRPRKLVIVDRTLSSTVLDQLVEVTNRLGLSLARGPDPTLLMPGAREVNELRPISVEDLLGRSQVVLDLAPVRALIAGQRILVTGAGGSIGSEIVRQVCGIGPAALCLLDASEFNLYTIDREVAENWPSLERTARVTDVRHRTAVHASFTAFRPDIVFHAAALKHVPLVEANPLEGVWTNSIGSRHVCDASAAVGAQALVMISTDKAVNPTNVMGASKRCAEMYCQALAIANSGKKDATRFVAVRFGNVLGSTGSVVPLFERQLKAGGPITVTDPNITRYFMTIREAVQLVMQASAMGVVAHNMQGKVFVLDMGQPVKIVDLARQMIRLAGMRPDIDVKIHYSGLRPGEKLFEDLFHEEEKMEPTGTSRINVASSRTLGLTALRDRLTALEAACTNANCEEVIRLLQTLVPEYTARRTSPEKVQ